MMTKWTVCVEEDQMKKKNWTNKWVGRGTWKEGEEDKRLK